MGAATLPSQELPLPGTPGSHHPVRVARPAGKRCISVPRTV